MFVNELCEVLNLRAQHTFTRQYDVFIVVIADGITLLFLPHFVDIEWISGVRYDVQFRTDVKAIAIGNLPAGWLYICIIRIWVVEIQVIA